jgi:hypothetical protein
MYGEIKGNRNDKYIGKIKCILIGESRNMLIIYKLYRDRHMYLISQQRENSKAQTFFSKG